MKEKIKVEYMAGESKENPGMAVDYMLAIAKMDGKEVELYAESPVIDEDEDANYSKLKSEILAQAKEAGIFSDMLDFM